MSRVPQEVTTPPGDDGTPASDPKAWIVGPRADELRSFFIEHMNMLKYAPTYRDDQRVLDASAEFVELPDGRFVPRCVVAPRAGQGRTIRK
ncbi:MAG: hypothetical protein KDG55_00570 [Rhodocyclaceae bacterium]|nr:hypothetical protein [Rhodocyclaceae bacterium]